MKLNIFETITTSKMKNATERREVKIITSRALAPPFLPPPFSSKKKRKGRGTGEGGAKGGEG